MSILSGDAQKGNFHVFRTHFDQNCDASERFSKTQQG